MIEVDHTVILFLLLPFSEGSLLLSLLLLLGLLLLDLRLGLLQGVLLLLDLRLGLLQGVLLLLGLLLLDLRLGLLQDVLLLLGLLLMILILSLLLVLLLLSILLLLLGLLLCQPLRIACVDSLHLTPLQWHLPQLRVAASRAQGSLVQPSPHLAWGTRSVDAGGQADVVRHAPLQQLLQEEAQERF
jgi:hypothetical protein